MKSSIFINQDVIYETLDDAIYVHNLKEKTTFPLAGSLKRALEHFKPLCAEVMPGELIPLLEQGVLTLVPEQNAREEVIAGFARLGNLTISSLITWRNCFGNTVYLSDWFDTGKNFLISAAYARTWELAAQGVPPVDLARSLAGEYGAALDLSHIIQFIEELISLGFIISDRISREKIRRNDGYVPVWALDLEQVRKFIHYTPVPWVVVYELTYRCNLACNTCYAADMMKDNARNKYQELSTQQAKAFLDELERFKVTQITLQGGEPFMRNDWEELVRYMRQKKLFVKLVTNGVLVTKEMARRIVEAGIKQVDVSLDGLDPETNDRNRYPGAFYGALEGIANLIQAGISRLALSVTLTRKNFDIVERLPAFVSGLGIKELHIMRFLPKGAGKNNSDWVLTRDQYKKLAFYLKEQWPLEYPHMFIDTMRWRCDCGKVRLTIDPSGNARACTFHGKLAGNVQTEAFSSIWQNSRDFKVLRQPYLHKEVCGTCERKYTCKNTPCSSRIYEHYQTLLSPECIRHYESAGHLGEYDPEVEYYN